MKKLFTTFVLMLFCASVVNAQIGAAPKGYQAPVTVLALGDGLQPIVTENGKISWSIDASGSNDGTANIEVEKPTGATVRSAYLMAASTGFKSSAQIADGDVSLAGTPIVWDIEEPNYISSYNYFADVTDIVKPIVDGASPGVVSLEVTEAVPADAEGETLVVIFDDPSQSQNTVVLAFGALQLTGDTFNIGLAEPIDKSAPGFALDMSLGISYSYQANTFQYSTIDINGNRLTSSAGGNDDGDYANGALYTTGGIGDTNTNVADPNFSPDGIADYTFYDDELYDLTTFVNDGDTSIVAETQNPSGDDNIFFAGLFLGATTAVVGEGIVLAPLSSSGPTETSHTVTATVQDTLGQPVVGTTVHFEIVSGPGAGLSGDVVTDAEGKADFTFSSSAAGTDEVVASFVNSQQATVESNHVTHTWIPPSNEIPEFGFAGGAALLAISMLGLIVFRRR